MTDLYTAATPNGRNVLALEAFGDTGIPRKIKPPLLLLTSQRY